MMKASKVSLPFVALIVFLLTTITGCSVLGVGAASFNGKVTINWLVRDDPQNNPWEYRTVSAFEATHPNIHVQIIISPGSQYYDQKRETMDVGYEPADVFTMWGNNSWADNVYRNFAADLTPYIQSSHFSLAGMNQTLLKQYSINGHAYAIPFGTGGSYLFYNVDMFKKAHLPLPPTNWDDPNWNWNSVLKDAKALSMPNAALAQRQYGISDDLWPENANAWLFGGDIYPSSTYKSGVVTAVHATSPAVEQGEQWKQDMIYKYKIMPTPATASVLSGFLSGKIGMEMTGVWGFWSYQPATFHWAVAPLPHLTTNKDVIFTDAWMMAKDSHHPQEAWEFIKWLSSPDHGAKTYMESSGSIPPWSQLLPEWAINTHKTMPSLSTTQLEELARGSLAHGQESINHMAVSYGQFEDATGTIMSSAFASNQSIPATLNQLQQQLEATIKKVGPIKPLR
ncbi:MAG TPA: extracellular solute-binding protein [Ktedonobacteraceae bacterium]|nr:extracellular solute-binding protein [Ktedonobacteraceae bacterium]